MDIDQFTALLSAFGDFGKLLTGFGDAASGSVELGGSISSLSAEKA